MKHIPFRMIIATGVATLSLAACGGGSGLDSEAIQQTAQALVSAQESANQTATALALAGPPTEVDAPLAAELASATPEIEQLSEIQLTLAAAATLAAPTIAAGQTLAAQTQAALPSPTPLVLEVVSVISEATATQDPSVTQDAQDVVVTVVAPPPVTLAQAWSQIYAAQVGLPFTITTDEEAMTNTIANTLASAGFGGNVDNLVVRLNNRLIIVEFDVVFGSSGASGRISFSAFAQDGKAVITMTSLQFGRFTLPPELLDALNFAISFALTGAANASQAQVTINDIFIDNGLMIINGVVGV